jgi:hypothetical protein
MATKSQSPILPVEVAEEVEVVETETVVEVAETEPAPLPTAFAPKWFTKTWGGESPQMLNLKLRYGVTKKADILRRIVAELKEETDTVLTLSQAEVILDQELEAEYQRIVGGAYDAVEVEAVA